MIYLLAVASVAFGGLLSACTPHLRPLIAFSGIAHAGYLLSGAGLALYPIFLYSFVYTLMFTLFCLTVAGQDIQLTTMRLSSLRGSSNLFVLSATTLQVAAFSLGGMPPLLGFFSKSYVLLEGICLANSFVQPILLMALGAVGIVAYLRLALATVGYPQTFSYLLHPGLKAVNGGGPRALLLGLVLLLELLSGDLSFALLV
jgi:NADH:ubiquinone oxidoreductase subunit 2 (subunit N)